MKKVLSSFLLLSSFSCFSQQRIGVEVFSRFEELSAGATFQKLVKPGFVLGAGINTYGKHLTYDYDFSSGNVHNPYEFVDNRIVSNGQEMELYRYEAHSRRAYSFSLMSGWFHEFTNFHGMRVNLNMRFGMAKTKVLAAYRNSGTYERIDYVETGWIPFQAISPEIYHTMRQTNKWTFYYGIRLPFYFNMFRESYSPRYDFDLYRGVKLEVCVGFTRQIGKGVEEKSATQTE